LWNERHGWMLLALGGAVLAALTRRPLLAVALALPWARRAAPTYGSGPRGRARSLLELPGSAVVDAAELVALTRGSIRHRTLFL
jgi:hypothetical protein